MRRAIVPTTVDAAVWSAPTTASSHVSIIRHMHIPGWKTMLSTGDARSKEQREQDRKARHLDKLPRPIALHAPQYPFERHVLADHAMQPIVFANELDTPSLFHREGPADFFVYWNANDFNRTQYPPVPSHDHRIMQPNGRRWGRFAYQSRAFLRKHKIVPQLFGTAPQNVNMSVVFSGSYDVRARTDDNGDVIPPPPPETELHMRNFWYTAHCGNYIDLHDLQQAPSLFFTPNKKDVREEAYYTFVMASPDYPYRTATDATYLLNYVVTNIPAVGGKNGSPRSGTIIVPYCPPLPTEDAGCARQVCMLYKQTNGKITDPIVRDVHAGEDEKALLPFSDRSNFRFHDDKSAAGKALRDRFPALGLVEASLPAHPSTVNFFHTKWDIQVQEYYERVGEAEPAYTEGDSMESTLTYLARSRESYQVRSRYLADGTINDGEKKNYFVQNADTKMEENSSWAYRSRRHLLGHNGREKILPKSYGKLF